MDFLDMGGGFTGKLFPTGHLVDPIRMNDGSSIDVTIVDLANFCVFFEPTSFGIGYTGLELPSPDGTVLAPPGMEQRLQELRLKVVQLIGMVYIKNERPPQYAAWREVDEITAAPFYLEGDSVNIQA